jgi:hypothetical protein
MDFTESLRRNEIGRSIEIEFEETSRLSNRQGDTSAEGRGAENDLYPWISTDLRGTGNIFTAEIHGTLIASKVK